MKLKVSKVDVWVGEIQDQPGAVAKVLEALAAAGAKPDCVIARRQGDKPGTGLVFVTPITGKKAQAAARALGMDATRTIATLRVDGPYRPDGGAIVGGLISQAGINVRGVSGVKVGKVMTAYIGFDSEADADRAAKVLRGRR
jgi:hypothetical protein